MAYPPLIWMSAAPATLKKLPHIQYKVACITDNSSTSTFNALTQGLHLNINQTHCIYSPELCQQSTQKPFPVACYFDLKIHHCTFIFTESSSGNTTQQYCRSTLRRRAAALREASSPPPSQVQLGREEMLALPEMPRS